MLERQEPAPGLEPATPARLQSRGFESRSGRGCASPPAARGRWGNGGRSAPGTRRSGPEGTRTRSGDTGPVSGLRGRRGITGTGGVTGTGGSYRDREG